MKTIEDLQIEIEKLKERNRKVEINKAWETSWTRKTLLVIITYFVITLTLSTINNPQPWINAIIPSIGFFLSTLTLPVIKKYWLEYIYKR